MTAHGNILQQSCESMSSVNVKKSFWPILLDFAMVDDKLYYRYDMVIFVQMLYLTQTIALTIYWFWGLHYNALVCPSYGAMSGKEASVLM